MTALSVYQAAQVTMRATLAERGPAAHRAAQVRIFERELGKRAPNTRVSYRKTLKTWAHYLTDAGVDVAGCDFYTDPGCWAGVTQGLVLGYVEWLKSQRLAVGTINYRLSSVRAFCAIASLAAVISSNEMALISTVRLIRPGQGVALDNQRTQPPAE